jgi:predicted permease
MMVYSNGGGNFMGDGEAQRVTFLNATHTIDEVLGVEPIFGRFFGPEEDHPDGPRAALLSQGFWEQEYASDPGVLGRTVSVNGYPVEIIGVLPPEARFMADVDMWMPLRQVETDFTGWGLNGIGRMHPNTTIEQARTDLMTIHKGLIEQWEVNEISSPVMSSLRDRYLGDYRLGGRFLLGAVGIVLLIACANIAGLMTARSMSRSSEMAVRLAMGAPRRRIVRQLLTESTVLAAIGATAGTGLGVWGSNVLIAPLADQFPSFISFDLDTGFLIFTVIVTMAAALLFGLTPALHASTTQGSVAGVNRATESARQRRGMSFLVTAEVAMALALLVVGGLSMLDVSRLGQIDPGFDEEGVVSYSLTLPAVRYEDSSARLAFVDDYLVRLRATPGIESATVASHMPLVGHSGTFFIVDGAPPRAEEEANPVVLSRMVEPAYFETLGIEFAAGRPFDEFDGREGSEAIIVNETFVGTHMSHVANPIGERVTFGTDAPFSDDVTWLTVVGVTRDVKHYGLDEVMRPGIYQPLQQTPRSGFRVALRARGDAAPVISAARAITREMDSELPVYNVETLSERVDESLFTRRATSWLIGAFSTIALLLAMAGIYGVISYSVG